MGVAGGRRARPLVWVALTIALVYGSVETWQRLTRPARWIGMTECGWTGAPSVRVRPGLRPVDSSAVVAHELVHAAQCAALGPVRYRWENLFATSKLALEIPAYCAGARERTRVSGDTLLARMTMTLDLLAAMGSGVDSTTITRAIAAACPEYGVPSKEGIVSIGD